MDITIALKVQMMHYARASTAQIDGKWFATCDNDRDCFSVPYIELGLRQIEEKLQRSPTTVLLETVHYIYLA